MSMTGLDVFDTTIHKTQVWQYLANLAYGVTTTRDPQTATTDVLSYADQVEAGAMLGPRVYSTGPGVFWTEPVKDLPNPDAILDSATVEPS